MLYMYAAGQVTHIMWQCLTAVIHHACISHTNQLNNIIHVCILFCILHMNVAFDLSDLQGAASVMFSSELCRQASLDSEHRLLALMCYIADMCITLHLYILDSLYLWGCLAFPKCSEFS